MFADLFRYILGKKGDHLILYLELLFSDGKTNCGRSEALAQRIQHVRQLRSVREPPTFANDVTMTRHDETVELVFAFAHGLQEVQDSFRRDPLCFRRAAWKFAVRAELSRQSFREG